MGWLLILPSASLVALRLIFRPSYYQQGTIPLGQKVQAVREFPNPINIRGLQEFVGMINFYDRFLPLC